jgi:hypothetical protein
MHLFRDQNHIEHNKLLTLALAYTEGYITNERLRYALNIHKADIYTMLKELCNMNFLVAEGYGRGTKYCIPGMNSNLGSNPKKKKRMIRNELRKEIVDICSDWVSLDYISMTIGRNADYLLSDVIPSMLKEGLIERMYPQTPRHPNQRYKKKG